MARDQTKRRDGEKAQDEAQAEEAAAEEAQKAAEPQANVIAFIFPAGMAEPVQVQLAASPGQMARAVAFLQEEIGLRTREELINFRKQAEAKKPRIARVGE